MGQTLPKHCGAGGSLCSAEEGESPWRRGVSPVLRCPPGGTGSSPPEPPPAGARCGAAPRPPSCAGFHRPVPLTPIAGGLDTQNMEKPAWGEEVYLSGVPSVTRGAVGCLPECGSSPEATEMGIATGAGRDRPRSPRGSGSPVRHAEPFPSTHQPFPPVGMSYTWVCLAQCWTSRQFPPWHAGPLREHCSSEG